MHDYRDAVRSRGRGRRACGHGGGNRGARPRARRARGRQGHVPARQDLRRRADHRGAPAPRAPRSRRSTTWAPTRRCTRPCSCPRAAGGSSLPLPTGRSVRGRGAPRRARCRAGRAGPAAGRGGTRGRGRRRDLGVARPRRSGVRRRLLGGGAASSSRPTVTSPRSGGCCTPTPPPTSARGTRSVSTSPACDDPRLWVLFEEDLLPGYAWVFPLPGGRANVGFGVPRGPGHRRQDAQVEVARPAGARPAAVGVGAGRRGPRRRSGRGRSPPDSSPSASPTPGCCSWATPPPSSIR